MKTLRWLIPLVMSVGLFAPAANVCAQSLEQVARDAARQSNGKVLSARTLNLREGRTHEVKVLTGDGRVRTVRVPDQSDRSPRQNRGDRPYPESYDRRVRPRDLPRNLERQRREDPVRTQDPQAERRYRQIFRDQNVESAPRRGRAEQRDTERDSRGDNRREPDNRGNRGNRNRRGDRRRNSERPD